jgi:hypothetical protein
MKIQAMLSISLTISTVILRATGCVKKHRESPPVSRSATSSARGRCRRNQQRIFILNEFCIGAY